MSQKKTLLKYTKYVMWGTVALIPPAAFFYLLEFYTHNPFAEVRPWAQLFNIVLFELLAGIFLCITGKNDRGYKKGDILEMMEFKDGKNTGRTVRVLVTYILEEFAGLEDGYCIMATSLMKEDAE